MRNIFISYSRTNEDIAKTIANDIRELGNAVWFDEYLAGGEAWWEKFLDEIRNCDIFIFLLSSKYPIRPCFFLYQANHSPRYPLHRY